MIGGLNTHDKEVIEWAIKETGLIFNRYGKAREAAFSIPFA